MASGDGGIDKSLAGRPETAIQNFQFAADGGPAPFLGSNWLSCSAQPCPNDGDHMKDRLAKGKIGSAKVKGKPTAAPSTWGMLMRRKLKRLIGKQIDAMTQQIQRRNAPKPWRGKTRKPDAGQT